MARLKYNEAFLPLSNKHYGFTFQKNHYGRSFFPASKSSRSRYPRQNLRQHNLQKCVQQWRNMDAATKNAWSAFAAAYPQPTKKDASVFLTGYQLFLKRNHYIFLNSGINSDFMLEPVMEARLQPELTFEIREGNSCIDITEEYISNFGLIPSPGQFVLFMCVPYSSDSGHFFEPILQQLEILETYLDGFFLSVTLGANTGNITFSVYLSKPVSEGQSFVGTKIRFMGCFSAKTFLELSDTPSSYTGHAGKNVAVKGDETGLEFVAGGGGGLTCEDLPDCPAIISINTQISSIAQILVVAYNQSIPAIKRGLYYNGYAAMLNTLITSSDDWHVVTQPESLALVNSAGGYSIGAGPVKETGFDYWLTPNTGATNSLLFNARGVGYRHYTSGTFAYDGEYAWFLTSTPYSSSLYKYYVRYNSLVFDRGTTNIKAGGSIRLCRTGSALPNGTIGFYIGNNGRIYRTIVIDTIEYLADNLAETHLRDGTPIPEITSSAEWVALTTPALCAWNNDWSNV